MRKIVLFGASKLAKRYCQSLPGDVCILGIADNRYRELDCFAGHKVIAPQDIGTFDYDQIVIALDDLKPGNDGEIFKIYHQLKSLGIPENRIVLQSFKYTFEHPVHKPRTEYISSLGRYFEHTGISGAVAECGVYRGWFSGVLSEVFEKSKLYLFDSFEGFSQDDLEHDTGAARQWVETGANRRLANTNEDIVALRILDRSRLEIRKGFIPDTLEGVDDRFAFVNLDMDLYIPQAAALDFFAGKMIRGGVILMHDYFSNTLTGTKRALDNFSGKENFSVMPIGDRLSIALIKKYNGGGG